MAELADARGLGPRGETLGGSNPPESTKLTLDIGNYECYYALSFFRRSGMSLLGAASTILALVTVIIMLVGFLKPIRSRSHHRAVASLAFTVASLYAIRAISGETMLGSRWPMMSCASVWLVVVILRLLQMRLIQKAADLKNNSTEPPL